MRGAPPGGYTKNALNRAAATFGSSVTYFGHFKTFLVMIGATSKVVRAGRGPRKGMASGE